MKEELSLEAYLYKHYSRPTAGAYKRYIDHYLQSVPLAQSASHKEIVNYIGSLRTRYPNPKTINTCLAAIKVYYLFLCKAAGRADNPARSIYLKDTINRHVQLQDLLTRSELESLMCSKERFSLLETRNKVIMSLLIHQALLPQDLASLRVSDIDLEQGLIAIKPTAKTSARTLSLKTDQIKLLSDYIGRVRGRLLAKKAVSEDALLISHRGNGESVGSLISHIQRYKHSLKGKRVNMTIIRQSVIMNLLKEGQDLRVVQVFAGHKCPSTTQKYKQTQVEALLSAVAIHHPIR